MVSKMQPTRYLPIGELILPSEWNIEELKVLKKQRFPGGARASACIRDSRPAGLDPRSAFFDATSQNWGDDHPHTPASDV